MPTLQVSDETYEKIKEQLQENERSDISEIKDMVGNAYFFRTVTYHMTGRVKKVIAGSILQLEDAAWIADSGRFEQAIKEGTLSEVEPVGDAYINFQAVVDFFPWNHKLPKEQK